MRWKYYMAVVMLTLWPAWAPGGDYNGRSILMAIGDNATTAHKFVMAQWICQKLWLPTGTNSVVAFWKAGMRVRHNVYTNQLAWLRCVNVDRLHADGRFARYVADTNMEWRAYNQATNLMESDARFFWCDVTNDISASLTNSWTQE